MRLNLGAGKVIFPWTAEKEAARHPLLNVPDTAYELDWVNVDALALPGINEVVDLFAYPWPWADNSVDEIWLSHVAEHIPHELRMSKLAQKDIDDSFQELMWAHGKHYDRWCNLDDLDGFYAFFAECWRVLKRDGRITVIAPYGKSDGALQDPQHTRYIIESTFHYLGGSGMQSPTYDYKLPFCFKALNMSLRVHAPYDQVSIEEKQAAAYRLWNVADEIRCELVAVKDSIEPLPNEKWMIGDGSGWESISQRRWDSGSPT